MGESSGMLNLNNNNIIIIVCKSYNLDGHPTTYTYTLSTIIDTGMGEGSGMLDCIHLASTSKIMQCTHADNGSTVQIVSAATVISVFVLAGVVLILGLLMYTIKTKRKKSQR